MQVTFDFRMAIELSMLILNVVDWRLSVSVLICECWRMLKHTLMVRCSLDGRYRFLSLSDWNIIYILLRSPVQTVCTLFCFNYMTSMFIFWSGVAWRVGSVLVFYNARIGASWLWFRGILLGLNEYYLAVWMWCHVCHLFVVDLRVLLVY